MRPRFQRRDTYGITEVHGKRFIERQGPGVKDSVKQWLHHAHPREGTLEGNSRHHEMCEIDRNQLSSRQREMESREPSTPVR